MAREAVAAEDKELFTFVAGGASLVSTALDFVTIVVVALDTVACRVELRVLHASRACSDDARGGSPVALGTVLIEWTTVGWAVCGAAGGFAEAVGQIEASLALVADASIVGDAVGVVVRLGHVDTRSSVERLVAWTLGLCGVVPLLA